MPINKNAFLRFKVMDALLASGSTYTREQIMDKIEEALGQPISVETFNKDLRLLRENFRAPIEYKNRMGYYYADTNYRLAKHSWNKEELAAFEFAYEALNTFQHVDLAQEAQAVLLNLSGRVHQRKSGKRIIYKPESPPVKGVEWLPVLYEAIDQERALVMKYYKLQTGEIKIHTISPYILRQHNDLWYVVAWCAGRDLTLVFALDRIREVKPANVNYFIDPDFDVDQYFKYSFGITHSYKSKPELVRFQILREAYYYIDARPLHHSQKVIKETRKGFEVELEVIISIELVMALLGMGNSIRVRGPIGLIEKLRMQGDWMQLTNNII